MSSHLIVLPKTQHRHGGHIPDGDARSHPRRCRSRAHGGVFRAARERSERGHPSGGAGDWRGRRVGRNRGTSTASRVGVGACRGVARSACHRAVAVGASVLRRVRHVPVGGRRVPSRLGDHPRGRSGDARAGCVARRRLVGPDRNGDRGHRRWTRRLARGGRAVSGGPGSGVRRSGLGGARPADRCPRPRHCVAHRDPEPVPRAGNDADGNRSGMAARRRRCSGHRRVAWVARSRRVHRRTGDRAADPHRRSSARSDHDTSESSTGDGAAPRIRPGRVVERRCVDTVDRVVDLERHRTRHRSHANDCGRVCRRRRGPGTDPHVATRGDRSGPHRTQGPGPIGRDGRALERRRPARRRQRCDELREPRPGEHARASTQ